MFLSFRGQFPFKRPATSAFLRYYMCCTITSLELNIPTLLPSVVATDHKKLLRVSSLGFLPKRLLNDTGILKILELCFRIGNLVHLETLDISSSQRISHESLDCGISKLRSLKKLRIFSCNVTDIPNRYMPTYPVTFHPTGKHYFCDFCDNNYHNYSANKICAVNYWSGEFLLYC